MKHALLLKRPREVCIFFSVVTPDKVGTFTIKIPSFNVGGGGGGCGGEGPVQVQQFLPFP